MKLSLHKASHFFLAAWGVLPFIQVQAASPDLIVEHVERSGITGNWQALETSGSVSAQITNRGDDSVFDMFDIRFFEDINGNGMFDVGVDSLLGTASRNGLTAGATALVDSPVSGKVLFRDNLIYALVDADGVIAEADEHNNISNSGLACEYIPAPGDFSPIIEWSWIDTNNFGSMMTPIVTPLIDTNGDGKVNEKDVPAVIFIASDFRLVAVRGDGGNEIFQVTDPAYRVGAGEGYSQIAVGDIDGDLLPEIITVPIGGGRLIAFENDGTFKWFSDAVSGINYGGPALADLDADGMPEIVAGATVLNADGTLRWQGAFGKGTNRGFVNYLSAVADVNMDGSPDIVTGNTVYNADGSVQWYDSASGDGWPALGNFDDDAFPEIAVVYQGTVRLYEHTGSLKWGPVAIPGGGSGGAPTVADVDGDGMPEVGVAGSSRYVVLETDGSVKWASLTRDFSSTVTGSSVFDFEADGSAEIVYNDEHYLRVYRGNDGTVLFETPNSSGTLLENPVIADVDRDGNAEIIVIRNNWGGYGTSLGLTEFGVFVYGDASDNWVPTRGIWNQHTYHITNVNADATIPVVEANNWENFNNYRLNVQTPGSPLAAPDLTTSYLRTVNDVDMVRLTARIGNGGAIHVNSGLPVSFYDGDPSLSGALLGTVNTTLPLNPGEYEDVSLELPIDTITISSIWVAADDPGDGSSLTNECDEANNIHDSGLRLPKTAPTAADDAYGIDEDNVLTVVVPGVLANDGDADGDPISASLVAEPLNGVVTLNADGSLIYVPDANFFGVDSFAYQVSDPDGWNDNATVSITVASVNDSPVANPGGPYTATTGVPLVFDGTGSTDIDGSIVSYDWAFGDGNLDTGPAPAHTFDTAGSYTVTLTVTDDAGETDSDSIIVNVETAVVQTVFDLSARAKSGKVSLVWTPVTDADSYNVYRGATAGGPYSLIAAGHASDYSTYLDMEVMNGVTYYYVVTSVAGTVESLPSNEAFATPSERIRSR